MKRKKICIVGRVNVGKSTLFNRLTRDWAAIVEDTPGVTRDRKNGRFNCLGNEFELVDTGGIDPEFMDDPALAAQVQSRIAVEESDLVLFLVDVRVGLLPGDHEIAGFLRTAGKPVILVANKTDYDGLETEIYQFMQLGFGVPIPVSAEHKRGLDILEEKIVEKLPQGKTDDAEENTNSENPVAIVGRANVGKSSLVNAILGQERHIVTSVPGTTRDSVDSVYEYGGKKYRLIDTAGIRRLGKTKSKIDKISVLMAQKSLERCRLAILVFDGSEGLTAQDARVGGYIVEKGRGCILAANKWDKTPHTDAYYERLKLQIERKAAFMSWAPLITISAQTKQRVFKLFAMIDKVSTQLEQKIPTTEVNKLMQKIQTHHPPPRQHHGKAVKFYYSTQIAKLPPTFLIFTNTREKIHFSYQRYIINQIRAEFGFDGCPIKLVFRHKRD